MGLKADVSEVAQIWRGARWRVKLYLALSLFLASGSVASLAETVFKWKGFLLDAIAFYRALVTEPATRLIHDFLQITTPPGFIDYLVVAAISATAVLRAIFFRRRSLGDRAFYLVSVLVPNFIGLAAMAGTTATMNPIYAWATYAFTLTFVSFVGSGAPRILAVSYMLTPLVFVSLLAAVNAGLTR